MSRYIPVGPGVPFGQCEVVQDAIGRLQNVRNGGRVGAVPSRQHTCGAPKTGKVSNANGKAALAPPVGSAKASDSHIGPVCMRRGNRAVDNVDDRTSKCLRKMFAQSGRIQV